MTQNVDADPALIASQPSLAAQSRPIGFDPGEIMQGFYLSRYYEPKAERPADNVRAAIEYTIDRYYEDLSEMTAAEQVGHLATRILAAAKRAGLYVGINIQPAAIAQRPPA